MEEISDNTKKLIDIPPGKYLLLEKNEFIRITDTKIGLLISDKTTQNTNYSIVLLEDKLILY